jgi:hypothetical protein
MNIKIITDVLNEDLYSYSRHFYEDTPYEKIKVSSRLPLFNFEFLNHVILNKEYSKIDYGIFIDEDCFIVNKLALIDLVNYVVNNDIDCIGMPDGGVCSYRLFNPICINIFFCILNLSKIREKFSQEEVLKTQFEENLKSFMPLHLMKLEFNYTLDTEEYYKFFFWMLKNNFNVQYLDAIMFPAHSPTTILKNHEGIDFAYHTWEARCWKEKFNRERILKVIEYCNRIKI